LCTNHVQCVREREGEKLRQLLIHRSTNPLGFRVWPTCGDRGIRPRTSVSGGEVYVEMPCLKGNLPYPLRTNSASRKACRPTGMWGRAIETLAQGARAGASRTTHPTQSLTVRPHLVDMPRRARGPGARSNGPTSRVPTTQPTTSVHVCRIQIGRSRARRWGPRDRPGRPGDGLAPVAPRESI
jgi:hypothetical protein